MVLVILVVVCGYVRRHSTIHLFVLLKFFDLCIVSEVVCVIEVLVQLSVGCGGFRGCIGFLKMSVEIPLLHFWRDLFSFVSSLQAAWVCVSCLLRWHLLLLITACAYVEKLQFL